MKKVLATILCLVMITSMLTISASANDLLIDITGRRTDDQVAFSVNIQNSGSSEEDAYVESLTGDKILVTGEDVWATNVEDAANPAQNAVDGNLNTKWAGYVGVVSIQNKVYNRQCYLEGSFKQPDSPIGYWNAFWLTGRDSWPPEIDIFETLSKTYGHNAWHTAIHGEGDKNNLFGKQTSSINVATGYHTFALDWGYDYVKFYVDGNLFQRGHNHATINFQKNMRLILNTGVGGWETEPDDTMVWNDGLRCKYIRSFQY